MILNIWLVDTFLPELLDAFNSEHANAEELLKQGASARQARRGEAGMALLISAPIAALVSACWYFLFHRLERKSHNAHVK